MSAEGRPLVELLREAWATRNWGDWPNGAHLDHQYDGGCAICRGDLEAMADVAAAVVREWLGEQREAVEIAVRRGSYDVRAVNQSRTDARADAALAALDAAIGGEA